MSLFNLSLLFCVKVVFPITHILIKFYYQVDEDPRTKQDRLLRQWVEVGGIGWWFQTMYCENRYTWVQKKINQGKSIFLLRNFSLLVVILYIGSSFFDSQSVLVTHNEYFHMYWCIRHHQIRIYYLIFQYLDALFMSVLCSANFRCGVLIEPA